jgi:hypothetical protein
MSASSPMSDKERALLEAARRELATRLGQSKQPPPTTSLEEPTVLGWDHEQAQAPGEVRVAADKWERITAIMEAERAAAIERRARLRNRTLYVLLAIAVALLAMVAWTVRR